MLESYQNFCLRGAEITSPVHIAAPDMCRQLIRLKMLVKDYIHIPTSGLLEAIQKEIQ